MVLTGHGSDRHTLECIFERLIAVNGIGPVGALALCQSPNLARLRRLSLYNNPIGPEGARAIAEFVSS